MLCTVLIILGEEYDGVVAVRRGAPWLGGAGLPLLLWEAAPVPKEGGAAWTGGGNGFTRWRKEVGADGGVGEVVWGEGSIFSLMVPRGDMGRELGRGASTGCSSEGSVNFICRRNMKSVRMCLK